MSENFYSTTSQTSAILHEIADFITASLAFYYTYYDYKTIKMKVTVPL